mmetsp:Transcript_76009/g.150311  ORF Transcript_76009/g.150311 Transcript_76009/m.150311 type:complete len:459 (-) Transcript_76009:70-1446(-)
MVQTGRRGPGLPETPRGQARTSLLSGTAEAVLWGLQGLSAVDRARLKTEPTAGSISDTPLLAGRLEGHQDLNAAERSLQGRSYGGCGTRPILCETLPEVQAGVHKSPPPLDEQTRVFFERFLARFRGHGAAGTPRLVATFRAVAGNSEVLDEASFTEVALREGLCRSRTECSYTFRHFAHAGGSVLHLSALLEAARGKLSAQRAAMVRDQWRQLDRHGLGFVEARRLLALFDPRRLPAVQYHEVEVETANREFFEGLGLSMSPGLDRVTLTAVEEAAMRRRPVPNGPHVRGGSLRIPAGKPTGQHCELGVRSWGDVLQEMEARPPPVDPNAQVTADAFEDYYKMLSLSIPDDDIFERTLREPWHAQEAHEMSMTARSLLQGEARPEAPPSGTRVVATLEDGSKRVLVLRDDLDIAKGSGRAGADHGQMWTWGREVQPEVVRRLEKQGVRGIREVRLVV